jgi:hypothetical protein
MDDFERITVDQGVGDLRMSDIDEQSSPVEAEAKRDPGERLGKARRETEDPVVVAHAAEARNGGDPCSGERCDV